MMKFRPTTVPTQQAAPDHLIVDMIVVQGLSDPAGMIVTVKTVWADAGGNILGPGPSKEILGSEAARERDTVAWDRMIQTILQELVSRGDFDGAVES